MDAFPKTRLVGLSFMAVILIIVFLCLWAGNSQVSEATEGTPMVTVTPSPTPSITPSPGPTWPAWLKPFPIKTGWNLVGMACSPILCGDMASELITDFATSGLRVKALATWQNGAWTVYVRDLGVNDFPIDPAAGYFVLSENEGIWNTMPRPPGP